MVVYIIKKYLILLRHVFFRIHNPPPPGLDRNSSPANASSDEGMHPSESNLHQMDKFENPTGTQPMMRMGYSSGPLIFLIKYLL